MQCVGGAQRAVQFLGRGVKGWVAVVWTLEMKTLLPQRELHTQQRWARPEMSGRHECVRVAPVLCKPT